MSSRFLAACAVVVAIVAGDAVGADAPLGAVYPEVWEWRALPEARGDLVELSPYVLSDGDVLISAIYKKADGTLLIDRRTFFSHKAVDDKRSNWDKNALVLSDGAQVSRVEPKGLPGSAEIATHPIYGRHAFSDGSSVVPVSIFYRQCYRGPANNILKIKERDILQYTRQRVFLVILQKPIRFRGGGGDSWFGEEGASCPNEDSLDLKIRVQAMGGRIVSLSDDTFLLVDQQHGIVIRIDKNLQSRSHLMNTRVFSFPFRGTFLVEDVLGKTYGRPEDETARISQATYQAALDGLYDYLVKIRDGR